MGGRKSSTTWTNVISRSANSPLANSVRMNTVVPGGMARTSSAVTIDERSQGFNSPVGRTTASGASEPAAASMESAVAIMVLAAASMAAASAAIVESASAATMAFAAVIMAFAVAIMSLAAASMESASAAIVESASAAIMAFAVVSMESAVAIMVLAATSMESAVAIIESTAAAVGAESSSPQLQRATARANRAKRIGILHALLHRFRVYSVWAVQSCPVPSRDGRTNTILLG